MITQSVLVGKPVRLCGAVVGQLVLNYNYCTVILVKPMWLKQLDSNSVRKTRHAAVGIPYSVKHPTLTLLGV